MMPPKMELRHSGSAGCVCPIDFGTNKTTNNSAANSLLKDMFFMRISVVMAWRARMIRIWQNAFVRYFPVPPISMALILFDKTSSWALMAFCCSCKVLLVPLRLVLAV